MKSSDKCECAVEHEDTEDTVDTGAEVDAEDTTRDWEVEDGTANDEVKDEGTEDWDMELKLKLRGEYTTLQWRTELFNRSLTLIHQTLSCKIVTVDKSVSFTVQLNTRGFA